MDKGYKKSAKKAAKNITKAYEMPMSDYKQTISIDEAMLPDVKNWKINKEYSIELKVKLTGLHTKYESDKICADFEIVSAETDKDD